MAATSIDHKRGDTFSRAVFVPEGTLYDGGTWVAKCEANDRLTSKKFALTANLIPPVAPETRYVLHLSAPASETALWPVSKLSADVEFIDEAAVPEPFKASSKTFTIVVKKDETQ